MKNSVAIKIRMKKLGLLLRDARATAGKGVEDCANFIGVSNDRIEAFELGNLAPSLPELETLAFYLDVPVKHFWGHDLLSVKKQEVPGDSQVKRLIPLRTRIVSVLLRKARIDSGLSIQALSECCGIPSDDIESFESGGISIPLPQLEILADQLNLDIEFFMDKNGIVGEWCRQQKAIQAFLSLPPDLQIFVTRPINTPYLEIAQKISGMSVEKLRAMAEGLLDITL
jgi:transcriptional regulator with XRE-family HTH domain